MEPKSFVARSQDWVYDHRLHLAVAYIVCTTLAIATDLFLVLVLHVSSISLETWIATQLHPTLIGAGLMAGIGVCSLVRDYWWLCMFNGILTGHLFLHW